MKRFLVTILALVYISSSTGASIHTHYCMGKLADWSMGQKDSKTCGLCGMEKNNKEDNGCCRDEHKFVKSDTDQKTAQAGFQFVQITSLALPVSLIAIPLPHSSSVTAQNPVSHAPPRGAGVAVYIRNRVFLI